MRMIEVDGIASAGESPAKIHDLPTKNNERFIVDRRGEPAVVIMSVQDLSTSRKTYQGAPSIGARVAERPE